MIGFLLLVVASCVLLHIVIFCITMHVRFLIALLTIRQKNSPKIKHLKTLENNLLGTHHSFMNPIDNPRMESWLIEVCGKITYLPRGFLYTQNAGINEQVTRGVQVFDVRVDRGFSDKWVAVVSHGLRSTLTLTNALEQLARATQQHTHKHFWLFISCSHNTKLDIRPWLRTEVECLVSKWKENNTHFTVVCDCTGGFDAIWFDHNADVADQQEYERLVTEQIDTKADSLVCVNTFCTPSSHRVIHGIALLTSIIMLSFLVCVYCIIRRREKRTIVLLIPMLLVYHILSTFIGLQFCMAMPVSSAEARQFLPFNVKNKKVAWMCDFV